MRNEAEIRRRYDDLEHQWRVRMHTLQRTLQMLALGRAEVAAVEREAGAAKALEAAMGALVWCLGEERAR